MQRRLPGDKLEFERIAAGLATVSLAVATSSAFPGFFPPISIKAQDIGASELAFTQQAFTDGGVFDNLGVRAFRFIERCWGEDCNWGEAATREVQTEQLKGIDAGRLPSGAGAATDPAAARAACGREQSCEAASAATKDFAGEQRGSSSSSPDEGLEGIRAGEDSRKFHEEFGRTAQLPSAPPTSGGFDAIITSDAGGKFMVNRQGGGGGLVRTAMRSSDILMDRVWQLEKEIVGAAPGFLFVPIAQVVETNEDPHALAPVVQRQVTTVRTDLDRFSDVEIRSLAKHGYAVARRACRLRPDLFADLPSGPPWDPTPDRQGGPAEKLRSAAARIMPARATATPTRTARELQRSADRRVWGTLIDVRDAMTYAFIPLVALILATLPYLLWKFYASTVSQHAVLETIAESNADQRQLVDLLRSAPPATLPTIPIVDVAKIEAASPTGFAMLTDFHIVDLRSANQAASLLPTFNSPKRIYEYRRLRVRRLDEDGDGHLRLQYETQTDDFVVSVDDAEFKPRLRKSSGGGRGPYRWELDLDLSKVTPGSTANVTIRRLLPPGASPWHAAASSISHLSYGETQLATMWLLLPEEAPNVRLQLVAIEVDPNGVRTQRRITPDQEFRARDGAVLGWQLLDPQPGLYECHWVWR
jgi:hypothetical protein